MKQSHPAAFGDFLTIQSLLLTQLCGDMNVSNQDTWEDPSLVLPSSKLEISVKNHHAEQPRRAR